MAEKHMSENEHNQEKGFEWYNVGLWGAIIIIGYFLFTEHRAHLLSFLPFALLLACPFMHLFMHHDGHASQSHTKENHSN
jgi:hypothetical protein